MLMNSPVGDLGKELDYVELKQMGTTAAFALICDIWEQTAELTQT